MVVSSGTFLVRRHRPLRSADCLLQPSSIARAPLHFVSLDRRFLMFPTLPLTLHSSACPRVCTFGCNALVSFDVRVAPESTCNVFDSTDSTSPTLTHSTSSVKSLGFSGRRVSSPSSPVLSALSRVPRHDACLTPSRLYGYVWTARVTAHHVPGSLDDGATRFIIMASGWSRDALWATFRTRRGWWVRCGCVMRLGRVGGGEEHTLRAQFEHDRGRDGGCTRCAFVMHRC
jgi:hypothetical protein